VPIDFTNAPISSSGSDFDYASGKEALIVTGEQSSGQAMSCFSLATDG